MGAHQFPRPGAARRPEAAHLPDAIRSSIWRPPSRRSSTTASRRSIRRSSATASSLSARPPPACSTSSRRRSRTAGCPASTSTPRWPTTSCRTASSARRRPGRPRRDRHGGRDGRRHRRDDAAGVVGDRGHRRVHRRCCAGPRCALFAGGYWINLSQPVLASSFALFGGVGYQYFVEGREKRKMKKLFGQYVSKDVFEQLMADPRAGAARRAAPRHDGALLGHPRLHGDHRARRSRKRSSACSTSTSRGWSRSSSATTARSTSSSATW